METICSETFPSSKGVIARFKMYEPTDPLPTSSFEGNAARSFLECLEVRRVLLVVFLVIRLGRIKFHRRQNFGYDRFVEFARARELLFEASAIFFSSSLL